MECEVEVLKENESLTVKMLNNYEALQLRPEYYMTTDETDDGVCKKPYLEKNPSAGRHIECTGEDTFFYCFEHYRTSEKFFS